MVAEDLSDPDVQNERSYEDLLVSIEANTDKFNLLIAVCDDCNLRDEIIQRYEAELELDIRRYQVVLGRNQPSLRAAIEEVVQNDRYLQQGGRAVLTVTGADKLFVLKLGAERSEQEIFFGYLQWTREALREFPYSIVVWITHQIERSLSKQAPDFWSWRKGVFRFWSRKKAAIPTQEIEPFRFAFENEDLLSMDDDDQYFLPLDDLQALIQQTEEKRGEKDPSLATLYARMGQIYKHRLKLGESQDYQQELALAIEYFRKAADLQNELGLEEDFASTLSNLAYLYYLQGRYAEAEPLYRQALELRECLLGQEHPDVATSLNNLAFLYSCQGRYDQAEPLHRQALELRKCLLGQEHPDVAQSLNDLALLYFYQGRYAEAEPLYQQALELSKHLLGQEHPYVATSLNNLAELYDSQGRYAEAEPLYQQALELRKRLLGEEHPDVATSLNDLALLYDSQGRYAEAEPLYQQALNLRRRLLGEEHPHVATSLHNLAELYSSQGRYAEAELLFRQALTLSERVLGVNHPSTITIRKNLALLQEKRSTSNS